MLDPGTTGIIVMAMMGFMLAVGVHIGVALGLGGILGMYLAIGPNAAWAQLATVPFSTTNSFNLAVIPLFILMGALATQAGLTKDLYKAAYNWLGKLSGGLAMATTLASAAFGAFGYDKRLSAGCIAASGTLASLIPPSILMVIYAVITEQSIARLLVAGLIPGLLSAAIYMLGIYIRAKRNPKIAPIPDINVTRAEKWRSLRGVWGISFLFILVIGGIYLGFFVPTYAGAVGAFGAFVIVVGKGRLNRRMLVETFKDAGITTSTIFIIVIGGILFARFLTYTGLVTDISDWLLALGPCISWLLR
jgi:TRAP-type C4-dicarboxylate transport system permease large subunit